MPNGFKNFKIKLMEMILQINNTRSKNIIEINVIIVLKQFYNAKQIQFLSKKTDAVLDDTSEKN